MKKIVFLLIMLAGCGRNQDPSVADYVNEFQQIYNHDVSGIDIQLVDDMGPLYRNSQVNWTGIEAICQPPDELFGHRRITITRKYWNSQSPTMRKVVIFHELGHCAFGRQHRVDEMGEGRHDVRYWWCPQSIMYPNLMPEVCFNTFYDHYIQELPNGD